MQEKYNEKFENQLILLAENKVKSGKYKVFDHESRVIKRHRFPEFVQEGKTDDENCLVVINKEGEALVLTAEFERALFAALKNRF